MYCTKTGKIKFVLKFCIPLHEIIIIGSIKIKTNKIIIVLRYRVRRCYYPTIMAVFFDIILILLGIFVNCFCFKIENLSGEWLVEEATGKYKDLSAKVPGGIYTDLRTNGIIGDLHYGSNDTETRWVAQSNWTYTRNFEVDSAFLAYNTINLVFEGLDTFAIVLINGVEVGKSQNMFVRYIFDAKNHLQFGNNTIEVRFISPIKMAKALVANQGYPVPPECPPSNYRGECHVNQIRKMQASFSWDWGPAFPSMGIWKEVYLEGFNSSVIRYVMVNHEEAPDDSWLITVTTFLGAKKGQVIKGKILHWLHTDVAILEEVVDVDRTSTGDEVRVDFSFIISKLIVRRWWPNGYGTQQLYNLTTQFHNGSEVSSKTVKIGFRKVELIQEPINSTGLSFYFKINDVPIFAKGANEIPLDILPEKGQNPIVTSKILQSAHDTNMNMLRVWGGGVYESEYFYEKADELGILIWQDFMFACAMYPTYPEFLSNVIAEVRHQVKRLNNHPSIVVWAGNNENEVALVTNWYNTSKNFTTYKNDFIKLYIDTIKNELYNITNNVIFLSSSPTNGKESEKEGYLAKNPQSPLYGDVHFYNYIFNSLDISTYPIPRFASEYGYQSLPSVESWMTATNNLSDLDPRSPFMDHRQHHPFGLVENSLLITFQLRYNSSSQNFYKTYIYFSQIVQAMSIKFETEYYRSLMGRIDTQVRGYTMGALYWQLNDVWVAPTWSGIDYTGQWKMLQYFAKDFFAPTIVTGFIDVKRQLQIYALSEVVSLIGTSMNISVVMEVYKWDSFKAVNSTTFNGNLEFGKSVAVATVPIDNYLESLGCGPLDEAKTNCFFYLTLYSGSHIIAPTNFILPESLKNSNLRAATITIPFVGNIDNSGKKFEIVLYSDAISLFVWLDTHGIPGIFSENGFLMMLPAKTVTFQAEQETNLADLRNSLTVTHVKDPQNL